MPDVNIVFNFDRTLTSIEGPVELARKMKIKEIEDITEQAMEGEKSFSEVFERRFKLYRPTAADIGWLADQYASHITPDADQVVAKLHELGFHVYIVSASYRSAILKAAKYLGIPALNVCAVDIEFDSKGEFASYDKGNVLTTDEGLEIVLAEIAKRGITIYIGDSVRDLDAASVTNCVVGYGGAKHNERVMREAHHYIQTPSLLPLLGHIESHLAGQDIRGINQFVEEPAHS